MPSCQWQITAISYDRVVARISIKLCARYHQVTFWEGDLLRLRYKMYERSLSYAEGKPFDFTYAIILYSPIEH